MIYNHNPLFDWHNSVVLRLKIEARLYYFVRLSFKKLRYIQVYND